MRSTFFVTSALAMGAIASPLLEKRYMVTKVDLEIKTVTVYVQPGASVPTAESHQGHQGGYHPKPKPSSSEKAEYTPVPAPSTPAYTPPPPPPATSAAPSSKAPAPSDAPYSGEHKSGDIQATFSSGPDYQAAVIYHHNAARANHGASPLQWSDEVAARALKVANTCDFSHKIEDGSGDGQNLFTLSGDSFNVTAGITESWYKGEFDAMQPYWGQANIPDEVFHSVGHLTAMLWKSTTHVGCASVDCGSRMTVGGSPSEMNKYTVCNYNQGGNMGGQYGNEVGHPISTTNLGSWSD